MFRYLLGDVNYISKALPFWPKLLQCMRYAFWPGDVGVQECASKESPGTVQWLGANGFCIPCFSGVKERATETKTILSRTAAMQRR